MRIFVPLLVFLLSFSARADVTNVIHKKGRTIYVLTYEERGGWQTQAISSVPGELQDVIFSATYATKAEADRAHKSKLKAYGYVAPVEGTGEADLAIGVMEEVEVADTGTSIWPIVEPWTNEWETRYSNWIASGEFGPNFFKDYQIRTDCADVIIASRWIFARMHGLPMANTLTATGQMVGHMTMDRRWSGLDTAANWYEDQRFLTALDYVLDNTYTRSLSRDSYPIKIATNSLTPGAHHLEFHEVGGHAMMVKEVRITRAGALIKTLNSTLPREVRPLVGIDYIFGEQAIVGTGFMRMKWPVRSGNKWTYMSDENYYGHSPEQYAPEFMNGQGTFSAAVSAHLTGNTELNIREWKNTLILLRGSIVKRANNVYDGYKACLTLNCAKGTAGWETHSSPGRDDTLVGLIRGVVKTVELNGSNREAMREWNQFIGESFAYDEGGKTLTYGHVMVVFLNGTYDVDPRSSIDKRWGVTAP